MFFMHSATKRYYFLFILLFFFVQNVKSCPAANKPYQSSNSFLAFTNNEILDLTVNDTYLNFRNFIYSPRQVKPDRKICCSPKILSKNENILFKNNFAYIFLKIQPKSKYVDQSNHCCFRN